MIYFPPMYEIFPLDIATTLFNNSSPDVWELLVLEGVQVPTQPLVDTNNQ